MFILAGMIVSKERFLSEEVEEVFGKNKLRYGILSGPSFAQEILELHPTIVVVASRDAEVFLSNYSFFDNFFMGFRQQSSLKKLCHIDTLEYTLMMTLLELKLLEH